MVQRQKYTSEFKEEAVNIGLESEQPLSKTAMELGIRPTTFYNWIQIAMTRKTSVQGRSGVTNKSLEAENKDLKKKLKRVEMERDILKKAAAYFASQDL